MTMTRVWLNEGRHIDVTPQSIRVTMGNDRLNSVPFEAWRTGLSSLGMPDRSIEMTTRARLLTGTALPENKT